MVDGFLFAHAYAVVGNGQRARGLVERDPHFELGLVFVETGVVQRFEAQLVTGVGRIRDQLAQKDFLVGVQRVRHQVQQLRDFGLEGMGLLAHKVEMDFLAGCDFKLGCR
ncbi:hypothetical protein D3C71_1917700 [compost metagenome]